VATGLNNPRHIDWSRGGLYVAEAGRGGNGPCVPSPEGGDACYGATGSITRIKHDRQRRVVTGLPSLAGADGTNAIGPADLRVKGRRFTVTLGLAADPNRRAAMPANGKKLATLATGKIGRPGLKVVADLGRYERSVNPDKGEFDTNPVGFTKRRGSTYVADAGGNSLIKVAQNGQMSTAAVFPNTMVPAPAFLGLPPGTKIPMQAVPTAVANGPDGALYVSQLTGFPFPVGGASIWRVVPGHAPTKYATGLTNVTDLAFGRDGSLYAVQIANTGLLDPNAKGSVVRIPWGGGSRHSTVIGNLTSPYGIALHRDSAYVTTCSTCAGGGQVLRVPLHHRSY
jgi:hypothetical protein